MCRRIWRGEGWPKSWKEGAVVPIWKKERGVKVDDYRGITIIPALHNIYAMILVDRLKEEVERKEIVPHNQAGFREGMSTMDNVYILSYLIHRQIGKKKGRLVTMFIDLKAAFDSVDRRVFIGALREIGIRDKGGFGGKDRGVG